MAERTEVRFEVEASETLFQVLYRIRHWVTLVIKSLKFVYDIQNQPFQGALEACAVGFTKLCCFCFRSNLETVWRIPETLLEKVFFRCHNPEIGGVCFQINFLLCSVHCSPLFQCVRNSQIRGDSARFGQYPSRRTSRTESSKSDIQKRRFEK